MNHPNFGWRENLLGGQRPQPQPQVQATPEFQAHAQNILQQPVEQKLSMEEMFM